MAERLFRVRSPGGVEHGPATPDEVCELIRAGRVMLDAFVAELPAERFQPITQVPTFARAFEARLGLPGLHFGSDSTPSAKGPLLTPPVTPPRTPLTPSGPVPKTPVDEHTGTTDGTRHDTGDLAPATLPSVTPLDLPALEADALDADLAALDAAPRSPRTTLAQDTPLAFTAPPAFTAPASARTSDALASAPPAAERAPLASAPDATARAAAALLDEPEPTSSPSTPSRAPEATARVAAALLDEPEPTSSPSTPGVDRTLPSTRALDELDGDAAPDTRPYDALPAHLASDEEATEHTPRTHDTAALDELTDVAPRDLDPRTPATISAITELPDLARAVVVERAASLPARAPRAHADPAVRAPSRVQAFAADPREVLVRPHVPAHVAHRGAVAIFVVLALAAGLGGASLGAGLGGSEAAFQATSALFYLRIALLLALGVGLGTSSVPEERLTAARLQVTLPWMLVALALGLSTGVLAPAPANVRALPVALSMTFLATLAEETFFRVYLDRVLMRVFGGLLLPVALGGVAFLLHALTYAAPWSAPASDAIFAAAGLALFQGVALSLVHHLSESFVPPLVCHLTTSVVVVVLAAAR